MSNHCRVCLQLITEELQSFSLDFMEDFDVNSIRRKLVFCYPELDLYVIPDALICSECFESINATFKFKIQCYETEERIQNFVENSMCDHVTLTEVCNPETVFIKPTRPPQKHIKMSSSNVTVINLVTPSIPSVPSKNKEHNNLKGNCKQEKFARDDLQTKKHVPIKFGDDVKETQQIKDIQKNFKCSHCNFTSKCAKRLSKHGEIHSHEAKNIFKCPHCPFITKWSGRYDQHLILHTTNNSFTQIHSSQTYFDCVLCSFICFDKDSWSKHVISHEEEFRAGHSVHTQNYNANNRLPQSSKRY